MKYPAFCNITRDIFDGFSNVIEIEFAFMNIIFVSRKFSPYGQIFRIIYPCKVSIVNMEGEKKGVLLNDGQKARAKRRAELQLQTNSKYQKHSDDDEDTDDENE